MSDSQDASTPKIRSTSVLIPSHKKADVLILIILRPIELDAEPAFFALEADPAIPDLGLEFPLVETSSVCPYFSREIGVAW